MAQTAALITALKIELRAQGKTYSHVAQWLGLSEAQVKRLFAEQNFSLDRLESILAHLGLQFSDLVEAMNRNQKQLVQLTRDQEEEIAADVELLLIAVSVISGFTMADLLAQYRFDETTVVRKLAMLDRLKMLDLMPGNRIRLRIAPNFRWLANGPIQQFFLQRVAQDFFASGFEQDTEQLLVFNGLCSTGTNAEIQSRLAGLVNDIAELVNKDRELPRAKKFGNTVVLAVRQWQYSLFKSYQRSDD